MGRQGDHDFWRSKRGRERRLRRLKAGLSMEEAAEAGNTCPLFIAGVERGWWDRDDLAWIGTGALYAEIARRQASIDDEPEPESEPRVRSFRVRARPRTIPVGWILLTTFLVALVGFVFVVFVYRDGDIYRRWRRYHFEMDDAERREYDERQERLRELKTDESGG